MMHRLNRNECHVHMSNTYWMFTCLQRNEHSETVSGLKTLMIECQLCSIDTSKISLTCTKHVFGTNTSRVCIEYFLTMPSILKYIFRTHFFVQALLIYFLDACHFFVSFRSLSYMLNFIYIVIDI